MYKKIPSGASRLKVLLAMSATPIPGLLDSVSPSTEIPEQPQRMFRCPTPPAVSNNHASLCLEVGSRWKALQKVRKVQLKCSSLHLAKAHEPEDAEERANGTSRMLCALSGWWEFPFEEAGLPSEAES